MVVSLPSVHNDEISWVSLCRNRRVSRTGDDFPSTECSLVRNTEETSQEDCLPFFLDDDSCGPDGSPSFSNRRSSGKSLHGFAVDARVDRSETMSSALKNVDRREAASNALNNVDLPSRYTSSKQKSEATSFQLDSRLTSNEHLTTPPETMEARSVSTRSRGNIIG